MINKVLKICFISLIISILNVGNVFAKYNYTYVLNAYKLARDNTEIKYTILKNISENEYTNKDVLLTINFNKEIGNVEGFNLSKDRKTLTKTLTENEIKEIYVEDDSGNFQNIKYEVNNIDKQPPQIIGCENGKSYNSNLKLEYIDNIGIKEVVIDKYSNTITLTFYDDYYDTSFFKGTDLVDTMANIKVSAHPKNTKKYKYYINDILKSTTEQTEYQFTGLTKGTNYTIKVEAIDENGKVLSTATRKIKTKLFSKLEATKTDSGIINFTVYGIDSSIDRVIAVGFTNDNNEVFKYPNINSNRSASASFSAQSITGNLQNGYYFFHLQLCDDPIGVVDTACFNIKFNENYVESSNNSQTIDINNLTSNGNYQITAVDFAGNKTEKVITINK